MNENNKNGIKEIVEAIKEIDNCEDISKSDIRKVVNGLLEVITEKLVNGEEINFTKYFKMYTMEREGRKMTLSVGKKIGKKINVPTKQVPKTKFSKVLKEKIIEEG